MISLAVAERDPELWARDSLLGLGTSAWLGYTYLYPKLAIAHTALPTCPFLLLTGHPCPFCGGTRSFSAMWRGDLLHAARLYPLGPLLFLLAFPLALYGLAAMLSRRSIHLRVAPWMERAAFSAGLAALIASWTLKLVWLGN